MDNYSCFARVYLLEDLQLVQVDVWVKPIFTNHGTHFSEWAALE